MTKEIEKELPKGILAWYDFKLNSSVLLVSVGDDVLVEYLQSLQLGVVKVHPEDIATVAGQFDYIIAINVLEYLSNPQQFVNKAYELLEDGGKLLLGVENRLGLKYFCGEKEPFTNRVFDGIENYASVSEIDSARMKGRLYAAADVRKYLGLAGFDNYKFYSVMPSLNTPQFVFAENYLPKEELGIRYFPMYNDSDTVYLDEEKVCSSLIRNGLFHQMANAYFIECCKESEPSKVKQVTLSLDRGITRAMSTIVYDDKVEKKPIYIEGMKNIEKLKSNMSYLRERNIKVIDDKLINGRYYMPYVNNLTGALYLKKILLEDGEKFIELMDKFRDCIIKSSDSHIDDSGEMIMNRGYIDLVPLNSFFIDGDFVFFDQEFVVDNLPVKVILTRMVDLIFSGENRSFCKVSYESVIERYDLQDNLQKWQRMAVDFLSELLNSNELQVFYSRHRRNNSVANINRQRMNFTTNEYQNLFEKVFEGLDGKKVILFGSGRFAQKFITFYKDEIDIDFIVDNSENKWGTSLEGIEIKSPKTLGTLDLSEYKIIICIKNYMSVLNQLKGIGVRNIGIYDTGKDYVLPDKSRMLSDKENLNLGKNRAIISENSDEERKKYNVGYVAGVFDLFHIGHLNLLKNAKKMCNYLIVGLCSDEWVQQNKDKGTFVSFDERKQILEACKYVDEVYKIPPEYSGISDAYRKLHFDVMFSGDDHKENPSWIVEQEFLQKNGSNLEFLPYTQSTSSSKLKDLIDKKLL